MAHWLLKSEPESYSWQNLLAEGSTEWTGVRNAAAALHLKAMQVGERAFFYHSGGPKAIVGTVEITRTARPDGDDQGDAGACRSGDAAPVAAVGVAGGRYGMGDAAGAG